MHRVSNRRNLTLPTFHYLPLHRDIVPQSTTAYLAVPIPLSSTSIAELRAMPHPHLADSINTDSRSFYFAECHSVRAPHTRPPPRKKKKKKNRRNREEIEIAASIEGYKQSICTSLSTKKMSSNGEKFPRHNHPPQHYHNEYPTTPTPKR